jgi:hypothetical protein
MALLLFLVYMNDLPNVRVNTNLSDHSMWMIFTDFEKVINMDFKNMNEWFSSNLLSLSLGKTHFMQFVTNNSSHNVMNITTI